MATDVKEWSTQCVACFIRAKVTHVEHSGVEKIPIPGVRFSHVHVDLVGPLPASRDGSTVQPGGQRWSPLAKLTWTQCWRRSSGRGWPALACLPASPPTGGHSSLWNVGRLVSEARGPAHHHHSLPPPGQRYGGADSPHIEGDPMCTWRGSCLERPPAVSVAGHVGCPQRGVGNIGGRSGPTTASGGAWAVAATH